MAAVITSIQTLLSDASALIGSGSYSAARVKVVQAQALMLSVPDSEHSSSRYEWARENIEKLLGAIGELESEAGIASAVDGGGMLSTRLRWAEPTDG
jgi:hypothetical protein